MRACAQPLRDLLTYLHPVHERVGLVELEEAVEEAVLGHGQLLTLRAEQLEVEA